MMVLVDTSAFYALLDRDDQNHPAACRAWQQLLEQDEMLATHNYIVVETTALVQRRLGMEAVRVVLDTWLPLMMVWWVDQLWHETAMTALLAAGRRDVSLVDWASFEGMRRRGIHHAFTFDDDFQEQGFTTIPPLTQTRA